MFDINTTKNLKIIKVDKRVETSIKRIVYIPTSKEDHDLVKTYFNILDVFPILGSKQILAGSYVIGKPYDQMIVENPKTAEEFLKSKSFAIPLTDNPVITQLYYLFYKNGATYIKEMSPLFDRLLNSKELETMTPLMLIAFLEANLNAENSKKPDLESHAYFILYKYMEHLFIFDQFMTCEQKGLEALKGGHHISSYGPQSYVKAHDIYMQLSRGIFPFISKTFIRKQQLPFGLPFVKKNILPFRLPFINKIYIENNSLDIHLEGKHWRIINDIDLLIQSVNFLAEKGLDRFFDNRQRSVSDQQIFRNLYCQVRSSYHEEAIINIDKKIIVIKKELDI
jgi:hypothetical protein